MNESEVKKQWLDEMQNQCVPDTAGLETMAPVDTYSSGVFVALNAAYPEIVELRAQSQRNLNRAIDAETELRKAKELFKELLTGEPEFYPSAIYPDPRGGPDLHEWALKVREFMRAES